MIFPVYLVIGVVNLLASNFNYNINATRNPNLDLIRVKRDNYKYVKTPLTPVEPRHDISNSTEKDTNEETPIILNILKHKKRDGKSKSKRDTYQQISSNNDINDNTATNDPQSHFKRKQNIFVRTYNAIASTFGYGSTTHRPVHYSQYNQVQGDPYYNSNNGQNSEVDYTKKVYTNQNTYNPYNANRYHYNGNNERILAPYNGNVYNSVPVPLNYNNNQINTTPYYNNNNYPNYANNNGFHNYNNVPVPYNNNYNSQINTTPYYGKNYQNYANNYGGPTVNNYNNAPAPYTTSHYNNQGYSAYDNGVTTPSSPTNGLPNSGNDRNGINDNGKQLTTEKILSGCILCSTFACPENQRRIGFLCRDVNYDDDDY